mmetsp:Transcript_846/g.2537  ORF Transcript_846/g.2537 Transcript_846/m.2537 type:complete len:224 (+) Transcript_846:1659-2330(+)
MAGIAPGKAETSSSMSSSFPLPPDIPSSADPFVAAVLGLDLETVGGVASGSTGLGFLAMAVEGLCVREAATADEEAALSIGFPPSMAKEERESKQEVGGCIGCAGGASLPLASVAEPGPALAFPFCPSMCLPARKNSSSIPSTSCTGKSCRHRSRAFRSSSVPCSETLGAFSVSRFSSISRARKRQCAPGSTQSASSSSFDKSAPCDRLTGAPSWTSSSSLYL